MVSHRSPLLCCALVALATIGCEDPPPAVEEAPVVVDAGSGPDAGERVDAGDPVDAGEPVDAGTPEEVRVIVTRSEDPACAGIGPQQITKPVVGPLDSDACGPAATSDGLGDVAIACLEPMYDLGWNVVYRSDGTLLTTVSDWGLVTPFADGFYSSYSAFGSGNAYSEFHRFDGQQWVVSRRDSVSIGAFPDRGTIVAYPSAAGGFVTQWVDTSGTPLRPEHVWDGPRQLSGLSVDALGRALVTWDEPDYLGKAKGQWIGPADQDISDPFDLPRGIVKRPLIGGGFLLFTSSGPKHLGLLRSGSTTVEPTPTAFTRGWDYQIAFGGRGYAFAGGAHSIVLLAADGTECGTIDIVEGAGRPQPVSIGIDGTVIQVRRSPVDAELLRRWWPAMLR